MTLRGNEFFLDYSFSFTLNGELFSNKKFIFDSSRITGNWGGEKLFVALTIPTQAFEGIKSFSTENKPIGFEYNAENKCFYKIIGYSDVFFPPILPEFYEE